MNDPRAPAAARVRQRTSPMTLVTLQRHAPVAPTATICHFCAARIVGNLQDDLLLGQPGTAAVRAVICSRCGDALGGLVDLCGTDLTLIVEDDRRLRQPHRPRRR